MRTWSADLGLLPLKMTVIVCLAVSVSSAGRLPKNPLATPEQKEFDQHALRLLNSPRIQQAERTLEERLRSDPWAITAEGKATLEGTAKEAVFSQIEGALNTDPLHPKVQWLWAPAHHWFGLEVPAAREFTPNVDNVFRAIPVDNRSHYEINVKPGPGRIPRQWTIQLLRVTTRDPEAATVGSELLDDDIVELPDGSFTLSIGPESAPKNPNHLQTTAGAALLLIRDTIDDWRSETPYRLAVRRIESAPPASPTDDNVLVERIVERIEAAGIAISKSRAADFQGPANVVHTPQVREGGPWGLLSGGHFRLADDEALVLTVDPMNSMYVSVQLANKWLGSIDSVHHTASRNMAQVDPNPDGTYTFVIAPRDPGVRNWIDSAGLHEGVFFVRWQKLSETLDSASVSTAIRDIRVVKQADLEQLQTSDWRPISAKDRRKEISDRAKGYARRFVDH
jgi:hypothetical protein